METTQIVWEYFGNTGKYVPIFLKLRATVIYPKKFTEDDFWEGPDASHGFFGGIYSWSEYPNIRDVSMNCAKLGHNSDSDFGNTGYSLRSYLIKHGFITPAK